MIEIIKIRIKLFFSRKTLVALFVVFPLLLSLVSLNFLGSDEVELKSRIGIVDEDKTELSEKLVKRLLEDETLLAVTLEGNMAMKKLLNESVTGLYTIKKGFSENIESGEAKSLIKVEYLSDNYIASGVTDIITPYFLYDVLKSITEKEVVEVLQKYENLDGDFSEIFQKKILYYENMDDLELEVITDTVKGEFDKPLYSPSKEIFIRYLVSVMLIFHLVSAFYQSMALYDDRDGRIIERIRMSRVSSVGYSAGNIVGIGLMIFVISTLQFLLLKLVFFSHLNIFIVLMDLLIYSMSISVLATALSHIFRTRPDYQMAVPYLVIAIWLLGNWMYSGDILSVRIPEMFSFIPGMAIKDHIISSFLKREISIDTTRIIKELAIQTVLILFIISMNITGRKHYERRS
jgi:ABC-type multidrug transport system permease subunit